MTKERQNLDLAALNTSLRKQHAELSDQKKELSARAVELKYTNEELEDNNNNNKKSLRGKMLC